MIEVGRICVKIAGRDAGGKCVVVDILDDNFVTIDGNVRRRKCNVAHLEPMDETIKISKGATHEDVKSEFDKLKISVWSTKPKKAGERPRKIRGKKKKVEAAAAETKGKGKKSAKKEDSKTAEKKEEAKPKEAEKKDAEPAKKAESVEELLGSGEVKAEEKK